MAIVLLFTAAEVRAQDWICDASFQDCRAPLLNLIHAEHVGIDVAFPLMTDSRYADAIIDRWRAGVPVRVLVDSRDDAGRAAQADILHRLIEAGIPVRERAAGGPLHWTMMLFAGQRVVQTGGGGYTAQAFVPARPYVDHAGAVIAFFDDPVLVDSFMAQYDGAWLSPAYAVRGVSSNAVSRRYPEFGVSSELTFSLGFQDSDGR